MRKLLLLAAVCVLLTGCGGKKSGSGASTGVTGCATVDMPITGTRNNDPPEIKLNPAKTYVVTFNTSCGNIEIRVDPTEAPNAAASFVWLVQHFYYDTTIFHRVVNGVLIQGGDPTGSGTGGPGYSTTDKVPANAKYTRGVVAMAKTATDPAGTAGGQFFIVSAPNAGLDPDYAIVGKVIKGMNVVDRISELGTPDQTPAQIVELNNALLNVTG
jgi:peptidyl-prolyl cis-trans isomerase B (cyclophilin B)